MSRLRLLIRGLALAKRRGYRFRLVNFGCGGETTVSLLQRTARYAGPGPGGVAQLIANALPLR